MDVFIDKIEGKIAELHFENDEVLHIDIKFLPSGVGEGDYLTLDFKLNKKIKEKVGKKVEELIGELSADSQGGDFEI